MNESDYTRAYLEYLNASPSPFHAAESGAALLAGAGFTRVWEENPWPNAPGRYYLIRGGALVAWVVPDQFDAKAGFSIWGCHTDSPCLKLKPTPQSQTADGWGQLEVETYGGMIYNSWLDRELILAGALFTADGETHLVRTGPLARIPQLAIHLDRTVNDKLQLNPQKHLRPVWTIGENEANITAVLHAAAGLPEGTQITASEIFLLPAQPAERFGSNDQFIAAGRQDNLSSVFAGLHGIIAAADDMRGSQVSFLAAFDHEEVGSATRTGAAGPLLEDVLRRTALGLGIEGDEVYQVLSRSSCISADAGHSVHPNYADLHDDATRPVLGRGPLLKLNAKQRYASEGQGMSLWHRVCEAADVPRQEYVSNNAVPCGSTIGPITATRLGITTVDVGIGLLSMHSAREMSNVSDNVYLAEVARTYLSGDY